MLGEKLFYLFLRKLKNGLNRNSPERLETIAEGLRGTLDGFKAQGFTQERMNEELNGLGVHAPSGGEWGLTLLRMVLKKLKIISIYF